MRPRLIREFRDDDEHRDAGQDCYEGVAVQHEPERLAQHYDAEADEHRRQRFPRAAAEWMSPCRHVCLRRPDLHGHRRTAPKVMPRKRCFRNAIVKTIIGSRKSVVPAATAGQFWPPSPMMKGINGGIVCASELVSKRLNAYSFHEKIKQKIAVAAMPVAACGSTTFRNACSRV